MIPVIEMAVVPPPPMLSSLLSLPPPYPPSLPLSLSQSSSLPLSLNFAIFPVSIVPFEVNIIAWCSRTSRLCIACHGHGHYHRSNMYHYIHCAIVTPIRLSHILFPLSSWNLRHADGPAVHCLLFIITVCTRALITLTTQPILKLLLDNEYFQTIVWYIQIHYYIII